LDITESARIARLLRHKVIRAGCVFAARKRRPIHDPATGDAGAGLGMMRLTCANVWLSCELLAASI
jgi:hypothetical protein